MLINPRGAEGYSCVAVCEFVVTTSTPAYFIHRLKQEVSLGFY